MQCGTISFAGHQALNIKSSSTKKYFNDKLLNFGVKVIQKHFEKFDVTKSIQKLENNPYLISLKSNGNPYLLFLTKFNSCELALMIDKKIQQGYFLPRMIVDRMCFHHDLFNDTIIDGEMVKTDGKWIFLLNDIIAYKGEHLINYNCLKRLQILHDILKNEYGELPYQKFDIQIKRFFQVSDIDDLLNMASELNYSTRGVYFKPMFLKFKDILLNFDDSLIENIHRVKYSQQNRFIDDSIKTSVEQTTHLEIPKSNSAVEPDEYDINSHHSQKHDPQDTTRKVLFVEKTENPDVYNCYDSNSFVGIACVQSMKTSRLLREHFSDVKLTDKLKFNCEFTDRFKHNWIPIERV